MKRAEESEENRSKRLAADRERKKLKIQNQSETEHEKFKKIKAFQQKKRRWMSYKFPKNLTD